MTLHFQPIEEPAPEPEAAIEAAPWRPNAATVRTAIIGTAVGLSVFSIASGVADALREPPAAVVVVNAPAEPEEW